MKIKDVKGVVKSQEVVFKDAKNVGLDYYEVRFEKPDDLTWRPGEHAVFGMPEKEIEGKKWRVLSIASTAEENEILLGFRTGKETSDFKRKFLDLKQGDKVKMRGPLGWFVKRDDESPVVMIALGVGVTPIRALLMQLDNDHKGLVDVVYSSGDIFMFKDTIDSIINNNETFEIAFRTTIDGTKEEITRLSKKYNNEAFYYISGTPNAIKSIQEQLKEQGIKGNRMINDPFTGYKDMMY